ncbi:MAG TPA: hypothetical protein VMS63_00035 [Gaiellaceae bacterium]|jgi:hypothetical protein|nr:hypothetical protein [Gaiellaceae bacterium]
MSAQLPQTQGLAGLDLLAAHCANLDPATPNARERLDVALGPELARKLVFALSSHTPREYWDADLRDRIVFAA